MNKQAAIQQSGKNSTLPDRMLALPGVNWVFKHTFAGGCGYIRTLKQQGKAPVALAFITQRLSSTAYRTHQSARWWQMLQLGMQIAQDVQLQNTQAIADLAPLMQLVPTGPRPRCGYDCAYSFIGLSLWAFHMNDIAMARFAAEQAVAAKPAWGYPHYLIGWYNLFDNPAHSVDAFERALQSNWCFFHRIMNDPICQRYPAVIQQLKQRVLVTQPRQAS